MNFLVHIQKGMSLVQALTEGLIRLNLLHLLYLQTQRLVIV